MHRESVVEFVRRRIKRDFVKMKDAWKTNTPSHNLMLFSIVSKLTNIPNKLANKFFKPKTVVTGVRQMCRETESL